MGINNFKYGHNTKGWEKIEQWIEDEDVTVNDLLALVCAKFNQATFGIESCEDNTRLLLAGNLFKITIIKEGKNETERTTTKD